MLLNVLSQYGMNVQLCINMRCLYSAHFAHYLGMSACDKQPW